MIFRENANVINSDGKKIGNVDRVVLDPRSKEVTHIVAKKGLFFTSEKIIHLDHVQETEEKQITLKEEAPAPSEFLDFVETHYFPLDLVLKKGDPGRVRPVMQRIRQRGLPSLESLPSPAYMPLSFKPVTTRNIPADKVPVKEGAEVISKDGRLVGEVDGLYTSNKDKHVSFILISRGVLSKKKKLISVDWVADVGESKIHLDVDNDIIESLPEHDENEQEIN